MSMAMTDLSDLRFFLTAKHSCSYLENESASNIFVDPNIRIDQQAYNTLSQFGFRRSGTHIYRPQCEQCTACIPYRVLTEYFTPNRSQRRCIQKNTDLRIFKTKSIDSNECYELYEHYIKSRHNDGDMYPPTRTQFDDFLSNPWGNTEYILFKDPDDKLLSVAVTDILTDGLSAMYSFFDCTQAKRSLGIFNILYQIQLARDTGLPYLYLGYWIKNCSKMRYKQDYMPSQLFNGESWISVNKKNNLTSPLKMPPPL